MKTMREMLFERHQAAEPRLDTIREKVVADLARNASAEAAADAERVGSFSVAQTSKSAVSRVSKPAERWAAPPTWKSAIQQVWKPALRSGGASAFPSGWRELLWSLRWHLAGLSAAWLVVLLLSIGHTHDPAQGLPRRDAPSPKQLLAALRENQRQLRELIAAPVSEEAPEPAKPTPSPRSQLQLAPTASA
jgi:hypothetical protein